MGSEYLKRFLIQHILAPLSFFTGPLKKIVNACPARLLNLSTFMSPSTSIIAQIVGVYPGNAVP